MEPTPDLDAIATDLADVETALDRLDEGTYWTDEVSGAALSDELLAERPTARRSPPPVVKSNRAAIVAAGGLGLGALAAAAGVKLGKAMSWRSRRMWRLTARNATRFAGTKARQLVTPAERRAALDEQFAIRTAEDVAKELGEMKGVLMKVGQLVSFIAEGLPDDAQAALAALQADAAPMSPTLAAGVVEQEFGAPPERVFRRWDDLPSPPPASARSTGPSRRTTASSPSKCSSPASPTPSRRISTGPR